MPGSRSRLVVLLIAVLGPVALFAAVYPLAWRYSRSAATQNVVMGDTALLVTAPELLEAIGRDDVTLDPRDESLRKERLPRGGRQLVYRFRSPKLGLEVASQVTVELDELDARATYAQLEAAVPSPDAGVEVPPAPAWGDEARAVTLTRDGTPVGHALVARKGTRVVSYRFVGVVFSDAARLEAFLRPRLTAVEGFAP